jgi:glucose-6-phosphate-specific signal transduction histidine kinase
VESIAEGLHVPVEVSVPDGPFPTAIEAIAYFLVAEALTNLAKHVDARHGNVAARVEDGSLLIDVSDDGVGARPNGNGLLGLRDRVVTLGGDLELDSPPGGGTRIAVTLPWVERSRELSALDVRRESGRMPVLACGCHRGPAVDERVQHHCIQLRGDLD